MLQKPLKAVYPFWDWLFAIYCAKLGTMVYVIITGKGLAGMKNSNFKIAISLIVFVISLALLVGGYQLYMKYGLIDPLKQQLEAGLR